MMNLRKLMMVGLFAFGATALTAQDDAPIDKRSELKVNAFYLILGALEVDYQHIINEESTFGVSATYVFEDSDWQWGITPHYRLYFGKQPALGFFVEGSSTVFGYDDRDWVFDNTTGTSMLIAENRTSVGLGLAVGGKFKTKRDVVVEVYGGIGRILTDTFFETTYPRAGISVGKRF